MENIVNEIRVAIRARKIETGGKAEFIYIDHDRFADLRRTTEALNQFRASPCMDRNPPFDGLVVIPVSADDHLKVW